MRAVHANCTAAFRHAGASQTCLSEAAVGKQSHVVVVVVVVVVGCLLFVVPWERSSCGSAATLDRALLAIST